MKPSPNHFLIASCALAGFIPASLSAQPESPAATGTNSEIAALRQEMLQSCKQLVEFRMSQYESGASGLETLLSARRDQMEVELKLARSPAERKAALKGLLESARQSEKHVKARFEAGDVTSSDLLQVRINRMRIEVELLEEDLPH